MPKSAVLEKKSLNSKSGAGLDVFMANLKAKNPGESEFHQAALEVVESLQPVLDREKLNFVGCVCVSEGANMPSTPEAIEEQGRGYVLIGPGRWGSADHSLGIPVTWSEIFEAKVIVESSLPDFLVEPS